MAVLPVLEGAFSLVLLDHQRLIGVRDPHGFRPLCLGKLDQGWVLASETPALDITGAHFVRELDPGELLVIDADGPRSLRPWPAERIDPKLCLFEFVYLARPDSRLYGQELHGARIRMGELLAEQAPVVRRHGDGRARLGLARGRGVRPAQRHPLRPRAGQEPLHRPDVHRPRPGPAGPGGAPQAQPAARMPSPASGWSSSTTPSCGARPPGPWCACCARPGPPRSTCASRRRRTGGPATTGSTPGSRAELIAANLEVGEIREYLGADSLAYLEPRRPQGGDRRARCRLLRRLPDRATTRPRCR